MNRFSGSAGGVLRSRRLRGASGAAAGGFGSVSVDLVTRAFIVPCIGGLFSAVWPVAVGWWSCWQPGGGHPGAVISAGAFVRVLKARLKGPPSAASRPFLV